MHLFEFKLDMIFIEQYIQMYICKMRANELVLYLHYTCQDKRN